MPAEPKVLLLPVTTRCNARCNICSIWKRPNRDLSPETLNKLLADNRIRENLQSVGITGGEPTLHENVREIANLIARKCVNLKELTFNTNGIDSDRVTSVVSDILRSMTGFPVKVKVYISLDGPGEVHDEVRGVRNAFTKATNTIERLKQISSSYANTELAVNSVINCLNVAALDELLRLTVEMGIAVNFSLVMKTDVCIESLNSGRSFELTESQKPLVRKFLKKIHLIHTMKKHDPFKVEFIRHLLDMLDNKPRSLNCPFRNAHGFLMEPDGRMFLCGKSKELFLGDLQTDAFSSIWEKALANKELWNKLTEICRHCESNCFVDVR